MQHFGDIRRLSRPELVALLRLSQTLQRDRATHGQNDPILQGKHLSMVFMKPSLRNTRQF